MKVLSTSAPGLTIVVPVYGCAGCLPELLRRIAAACASVPGGFELVLVNDASPDGAWERILGLVQADHRVRGVNLSRNFGQHAAITAGVDEARGAQVVVMDCDLQDRPEEIPRLLARAAEGYDIVFARRHERQDTWFKRTSSRLFWSAYDYLTEHDSDPTVANFGVYSRRVIDSVKRLREQHRNFPLAVRWLGFRTGYVDVEHAARSDGRTSYTLRKLLNLALDSVVAHSNKPLRLSIQFGLAMAVLSLLFGVVLIVLYFVRGVTFPGWTSVMVSLFFLSGLLFANLGMLGLYVGKIFDEVKARPIYVVADVVERDDVTLAADPAAPASIRQAG